MKVEEEGPINSLFDPDTFVSSTNEEQVTTSGSDSDTIAHRGQVFISDELYQNLLHAGNNLEDITMIR